jgi:hypothetical protein
MANLLKRAPPAAKKVIASQDIDIELSSNEGRPESRIIVAQHLWGGGNYTPYDHSFVSSAILALAVNGKSALAVVAPYVSSRLTRLSEELKIWIDVYQTRPIRFSLDGRKAEKIKRNPGADGTRAIPKRKFSAVIISQPSQVTNALGAFYGECRNSLRSSGQIFVADLVAMPSFDAASPVGSLITGPNAGPLMSLDAHRRAFAGAKLTVQREVDTTREVMNTIRDRFVKGMGKLADYRALEEPWRKQRLDGFLAEVEAWFLLHRLLEQGHVTAKGFLLVPEP